MSLSEFSIVVTIHKSNKRNYFDVLHAPSFLSFVNGYLQHNVGRAINETSHAVARDPEN